MANNTVEVIYRKLSESGGHEDKESKITSVSNMFNKKIAPKAPVGSGNKLGMKLMSGAKKLAPLMLAKAVLKTAEKGVNIYSTVMMAKSGDTIQYENLNKKMSLIANPGAFAKKAVWEYGILEPMKVARENEKLEYNRQLTGSLIYSKRNQSNTL